MSKFIHEVEDTIKSTDEYRMIGNPYRIAASKFAQDAEDNLLKNLDSTKKHQVYRDISRIFDKEPEGQQFKSKIRKIVGLRLEEIRRQTKENKWNVSLELFQQLLLRNKGNRDVLDLLAFKELPMDFRQIVWRFSLENDEISEEYAKKMRENKILTISKFDVQIIKDSEVFLKEYVEPEQFDGSMIFAMKTVLSYYEVRRDRILSDYLFRICIPLIYVYGGNKHMHKIPTDLIGYFFSLQQIVQFFDPLVDLVVKHDEIYDAEMTELIMNTLDIIDRDLADKIANVLNLQMAESRSLMVMIGKMFIHSLGFAYLPLDVTIYVWDQIFMKVQKNRLEIFVVFSTMLVCLKDRIMLCELWDQVVDVIYQYGRKIDYTYFVDQYKIILKDQKFYLSPYNVNPEIVNREPGDGNQLQQLQNDQQNKDKKMFNQEWNQNDEFQDDEMDDIKMEELKKGMTRQQQPAQRMGMVPVFDEQNNQYDDQEVDIFNNYNPQ